MDLWPIFGGRSEYLKAPKEVVHRCHLILIAKRRAEADDAKETGNQ
jgi:hypothetical protein